MSASRPSLVQGPDPRYAHLSDALKVPKKWHSDTLDAANGRVIHADLRDGFYPYAQKVAESTHPDLTGNRVFAWLNTRFEEWRQEQAAQRVKAERRAEMEAAEAKRREMFG